MPEIQNNQLPVTQSRWTSKLMWGAIIVQLVTIGGMLGLWAQLGITAEWLQGLLNAILQMAVIVGIVNDPTNKNGW